MKKLLAAGCVVVALLVSPAARAQGVSAMSGVHLAFNLGLTGGGDKLVTAHFIDGSTSSIRAGGLVQIGGGVLWEPPTAPFAVQAMFSYHVDDVSASNGSLRFSRYPLEVLGYYTALPRWRFGAGPRFVFSPRLKVDLPGENTKITYDDTIGAVAEVGYQLANYAWLNLRVTAEKYEVKSLNGTAVQSNDDVSANSVGLNLVFYF